LVVEHENKKCVSSKYDSQNRGADK
jgi:hypothetical protein